MIKYLLLLCIYIPFYLLAMLVAPILPLFAELRNGPIDNNNGYGVEPRLPSWLSWFDTGYDNGLWGDHGWRTKHCQKYWQTYLGMVLWLWRNPAAGFCWSVLSRKTLLDDQYAVSHSGNGLDVDKGKGKYGWYFIRCARDGAFSLRWCKQEGNTPLPVDPPPPPPPIRVSPWQMRKAINAVGLRAEVELAVQNSTDIDVKDGWEFATEFVESDPFVVSLGESIGKSPAELHALFELAASL